LEWSLLIKGLEKFHILSLRNKEQERVFIFETHKILINDSWFSCGKGDRGVLINEAKKNISDFLNFLK